MRKSMVSSVGLGIAWGFAVAWASGDVGGAAKSEATDKAVATQPSAQPVSAAEITRLIEQLGSNKLTERNEAEKALAGMDGGAATALAKAAKSPNAEVAARAGKALREIGLRTRSTYLEGQVVAPDGKPASRAKVMAIVWWRDSSGRRPCDVGGRLVCLYDIVELVCDEAGRFNGCCKAQDGDTLTVDVQAVAWSGDGRLCGFAAGQCVWPESVPGPLRIALALPGSARLKIVGAMGKPVLAAEVVVQDEFRNPNLTSFGPDRLDLGVKVRSLGDGNYDITGLVPGREYSLHVKAPNANSSAGTLPFKVKPGETHDAGTLSIGVAPRPAAATTSPATQPETAPRPTGGPAH